MLFITSGLWVWAAIFILSMLKIWNAYSRRNDSQAGGGEDLSIIGHVFWTFLAICAAPISGVLLLIALFGR